MTTSQKKGWCLAGMILFAIVFAVDAPDEAKIARIKKDYDEWHSIADKTWRIADLQSKLAANADSESQRLEIGRDSVSSGNASIRAEDHVIDLGRQLHDAKSTGRPGWLIGFLCCGFLFVREILRDKPAV
jgi:hypothetical protein